MLKQIHCKIINTERVKHMVFEKSNSKKKKKEREREREKKKHTLCISCQLLVSYKKCEFGKMSVG